MTRYIDMTLIDRATRYCIQTFACFNGASNDIHGNIYKHDAKGCKEKIAYVLDDGCIVSVTGDFDKIICVLK